MKCGRPTLNLLLWLLVLSSAILNLQAQDEVRFQLSASQAEAEAGSELTAIIHAEIASGWHLYGTTRYPKGTLAPQPTTIDLEPDDTFLEAGAVKQPAPKVSFDENFQINTEYYEGRVDFELPVRVAPGATPGQHPLNVRVRFMACNDRLCLPPRVERLSASVQVTEASPVADTGGGGTTSGAATADIPDASSPAGGEATGASLAATRELPTGTLAYIWFAMVFGGLALLTPCVFPMIPITVSYFTKREVSRSRAVGEAALYSLGIILTFTLLGFLLTFLFGAGGINRVATSPVVNIAIAAIFVVFAFSLFGVFEIRVPSGLLSAVNRKSSATGGAVGILLMALTFSLTSFTCTVPFVGTVMVAATQGDWLWSLLGVAAFATVFSAPFFFLALFPSLLKSLPKSGGWMNSVKITMGFLELAAALKFISNVDLVYQWELVTRPVFITVWLAIALVTSLYLLGKFYFPHEAPTATIGAGRVMAATLFLAVSFYLFRGLLGFPLGELDAFLPPRDYGSTADQVFLSGANPESAEQLHWGDDYAEALQMARDQGRSIFIDFTGYTCTNCRWMESNIFVRTRVRKALSEMVLVRLYTDGAGEESLANLRFEQERFGTIALPLYALMDGDDRIIATYPGLTRDENEFLGFLKKGLASTPEGAQAANQPLAEGMVPSAIQSK